MTGVPIPRQDAVFDERRNSSRVFPVSPDALPEALAALAAFRRSQPDLYRWVAAGAPPLSETDHLARFGERYKAQRAKRNAGQQSITGAD